MKRIFEDAFQDTLYFSCPVKYNLLVRQHPERARLCSFRDKVDRRPIDPPPIVQLKIEGCVNENYLQNIYYFVHCNLVHPVTLDEVNFYNRNRVCVGTTVQSLYKLKDVDNTDGGFFTFSDISIRVEGVFRLKFVLYEIRGMEAIALTKSYSNPFTVYPPKFFPGMAESTFLTRMFSDQGVRLRTRRENRAQPLKQKHPSVQEEHPSTPTLSFLDQPRTPPYMGHPVTPPPPSRYDRMHTPPSTPSLSSLVCSPEFKLKQRYAHKAANHALYTPRLKRTPALH
ncbi:uncharacterized protein VTP21DRAFT_1426 [Calcarisporiella thermophila]|uniref:uncharacterized protein n=1 Tax=Calcarisporiella thermophila TaxID=911321 RepID=UPI0037430A0C